MAPTPLLQGKVGIVTGAGVSGGLGAETARVLAEAGAKLVLADLPGTDMNPVLASLAPYGGHAVAHHADIASEPSVITLMQAAIRAHGRLDFVVNNAALAGLPDDTDILNMSVALWDSTMAVNARGTMLMCKHAVPLLIEAGGGSIVNISSGTAAQGDFYASAYAASKGAINTLTKYVATQYGARGVRCNALAPGLILTPKLKAAMPPAMQEVFRQHCLTGALGRPAQIGQTILFLVSDHSSFITGQVISADGGLAAHVPTTVEVARLFAPA